MKLVKEILYEKFEEKSDPIKDMGIGKICLGDDFNRMVKPALDEFDKIAQSLVGQTITGVFDKVPDYVKDATIGFFMGGENKEMSLKVKSIRFYGAPNMIVETEDGYNYIMKGDREYKIQ